MASFWVFEVVVRRAGPKLAGSAYIFPVERNVYAGPRGRDGGMNLGMLQCLDINTGFICICGRGGGT